MTNEQNRPDHAEGAKADAKLDQALEETFPGSDAPATTREGSRVADKAAESGDHASALPNSDREATEKAHKRS